MTLPQAPRPLCVLVVDDNRDCADLLCKLVEVWGHYSFVAYDSAAALGVARTWPLDIVFLDLGLPGISGWELARRLRAEPGMEKVQLVAVTGLSQPAELQKSHEAGLDCHLLKPVDPELLRQMLAAK